MAYKQTYWCYLLFKSRHMSEPFQRALIGTVLQSTESTDLRLREEVSRIPSSTDGVVEMLSRCLPYIVPNVLLAKREVGTPRYCLFLSPWLEKQLGDHAIANSCLCILLFGKVIAIQVPFEKWSPVTTKSKLTWVARTASLVWYINPFGSIERLSVSSKIKKYLKLPKRRFLYIQNEITYSIVYHIWYHFEACNVL